ncbi:MAG: DUF2807 domain-containing protein [Muribaculaceae bacterium]|nr:DUF2807 domain-containing protein [Muribaculaceae bacterium]
MAIFIAIFMTAVASLAAQEVHRYELKVGDFNRLVVDDGINVEYRCSEDSAGLAVYETTRAVADQLIFDFSKKGRLMVQKQFHGEGELTEGLPVVKVYSKFLSQVQNNGDSTVIVASVAACPEFKATVIGNGRLVIKDIHATKFEGAIKTGNGQLVVSGKCDQASFSNTGVGSVQADNLEAADVSCRFFGTGTTGVWATESLTIKGMFPGKLYYKGNPAKVRNYSMGVKIFHMDAEGKITEEAADDPADMKDVKSGAEED